MTTKKIQSTRDGALLAELKHLVDSFPAHKGAEVIALVRRVFTLLKGRAELVPECDQSGDCPDCVKFTDTLMDQFATYPQSEAEVRSSASFGSIPLFVLEHHPKVGLAGEGDEAFEEAWIGWQRDLAMRSSNSKLEVVTGVGHEIQTDQPQRVVDAIGWVMKQLDQSATGEEVRSAERSQAGSH